MPARRRAKEIKRKLRAEVARIDADQQREATLLLLAADPLHDHWWREHEAGGWCCIDCSPHHPDRLLNDAIEEIAAYKERLP